MANSSHPNSRFSRIGFNLGLKSQTEYRNRAPGSRKGHNDEEWYIPYTGPYEPPPEPRSSRNKDRDSWGDPIFGPSNGEALDEDGPHVHCDGDLSDQQRFRTSGESRVRGRGRSHSVTSYYTASTGVDHNEPSSDAQRRSTVSSYHRPPVPSYVNLDVGGVGESPVPHLRQAKDRPISRRASLASVFSTFGVKSPSTPGFTDRGIKSPSRKRSVRPSTGSGAGKSSNGLSTNNHRRTTSGDTHNNSIRAKHGIRDPLQSVDSRTTTDEDYYNSYYSTLIQTPAKSQTFNSVNPLSSSDSSPSKRVLSTSQHPYALAFPQPEDRIEDVPTKPKSAPPSSETHPIPTVIPKLTFSESHDPSSRPHGSTSALPNHSSNGAVQKKIKASVSTPNLLSAKNTMGASRNLPKGIDRWFSAETWCDALLFPRPRLKIKNEGSGNGRIVSPPGSPVLLSDSATRDQVASVPSRVLAHSRSLVSLTEAREEHRREQPQVGDPLSSQPQPQTVAKDAGQAVAGGGLRPPRPKSWAQDDLDLPSPVPSLAKVLEDGERLISERKKWQDKAFNSLGNKQARNISRSRSKSLTAKGRKTTSQVQSNIDFLAARAVHGNQDVIPVVPSVPKHHKNPSHRGTISRSSHSRSNSHSQTQTNTSSLIRSLTHSSKSHSRDHSRSDSWSKSAFKAVKATAAPCCNGDATATPTDEKDEQQHNELESALQHADTRIIHLTDPALAPVEPPSLLSPGNGPSPTPSGVSSRTTDPRVGIAISTPLTDESYNRENARLASHPYAQAGLYSYNEQRPSHEKRAEYVGPHPVQTIRTMDVPDGPAARHKLPPHVTLSHPYAQAQPANRDSYDDRLVQHVRPDSDVPPHAKMWAPLAPGVVREVLPAELKYSPFIDADGKMEDDMEMVMAMSGIVDTVGVGEALAYAAEYQEQSGRDSGIGTSESVHGPGPREGVVKVEMVEDGDLTARLGSPSRAPVQYDVTRPIFRLQHQRVQRSPETGHTFASSPLEHHLTPRIPGYVRHMNEVGVMTSPMASSESSSRRTSPRPLGSPNDLVGFQDLFYKPGTSALRELRSHESLSERSSNGSQTRLSSIPFDLKSPHRRPASGLTTLARKLSEEYEQLSVHDQTNSQYSQSSASPRPPYARRPTEGSLEFVFEEMTHPDSLSKDAYASEPGHTGVVLPFGPEENIPEDVASASSMENEKVGEDDSEDPTEVFHIKQVETATPSAVETDHRLSFTGQMGYQAERHEVNAPRSVSPMTHMVEGTETRGGDKADHLSAISSPTSEARVLSGLQPPLTDVTRSSYITTSTTSRMSGLSDFPVPPKDFAHHRMSLLSAFFNDANGRPSLPMRGENGPSEISSPQNFNSNNRLTFGAGADAEEIVQALSNHPRPI